MELFILWIGLALLVGVVGKDRNIGFGWSFFWSLILSPLIGVVIALLSDKKNSTSANNDSGENWQREYEAGKRAEYKGQIDNAIDSYMNTLYYLETYDTKISKSSDNYRIELISKIKTKVQILKQNKEKEHIESTLKT